MRELLVALMGDDCCDRYTLTTAGSQGMLALLPVFLDHIMYPLITDSGFLTEIHHVDGQGADAGKLVYLRKRGIVEGQQVL